MTSGRTIKAAVFIIAISLSILPTLTLAPAQQPDIGAIGQLFREYYTAGNYAAALVEAQKLEDAYKAQFGDNNVNYAIALHNVAIVYQQQRKYAEAEEYYKRALAVREKALGESHPGVAAS